VKVEGQWYVDLDTASPWAGGAAGPDPRDMGSPAASPVASLERERAALLAEVA